MSAFFVVNDYSILHWSDPQLLQDHVMWTSDSGLDIDSSMHTQIAYAAKAPKDLGDEGTLLV